MTDQLAALKAKLREDARLFCARRRDADELGSKSFLILDLEYEYDDDRHHAYRTAEGKGAEERTRWPFHRVCCASWLPVTFQLGTNQAEFGELATISARDFEERDLIEALFAALNAAQGAAMVTWGGECKDYPVLRRSAAEFGLLLPASLSDLHPFSRSRIDLCNDVAGRAASVHLPEYAAATSIPCKPSPSKDIGNLVRRGAWDAVEEQCRADVLTTTVILLRHLASRGEIEIDLPATFHALAQDLAQGAPANGFVCRTFRRWAQADLNRSHLKGHVYRKAA